MKKNVWISLRLHSGHVTKVCQSTYLKQLNNVSVYSQFVHDVNIQDAKNRKKNSPSGHRRTTLSGYNFATKAYINNGKNMLNNNISSTCPQNMVNFGPLAAEIGSLVWGTSANFNGFASWGVTARHSSSGCQPNCGVEQRAPPIFGRVAITLGIGPHSIYLFICLEKFAQTDNMQSINQSINHSIIFSGLSSNATARPLWVLQLRNVT